MFDFHKFLMEAIIGMAGNYPDWQVQEYALGWYTKGKLNEEDLAEIDLLLHPAAAETAPEELPEENTEYDQQDKIV